MPCQAFLFNFRKSPPCTESALFSGSSLAKVIHKIHKLQKHCRHIGEGVLERTLARITSHVKACYSHRPERAL